MTVRWQDGGNRPLFTGGNLEVSIDNAVEVARLRRGPAHLPSQTGLRLMALLGYVVFAVGLTYPSWRHPATEWIGGPSDPMKFMEFLGWYPFAIVHGLNPLLNSYVNLPGGSNMMWDTTMPLVGIVLWPITAAFGVIATLNVAVTAALVLDGYCTFLWLRRHVRHALAAWFGALLMMAGPYAFARTFQVNLLLFFPIPLLVMELEKVYWDPRRDPRSWGLKIGLLLAVQVLCTEEVLGLAAVALGTGIAISAIVFRSVVRERAILLLRSLGVDYAVPVFVLIAGGPIAYQFFGPGRIRGPIQKPDVYVTDVVNWVIPGTYTALNAGFASHLASHWSGGPLENDAYIGLPLLAVAIFVSLRWYRDPWVRILSLTTLAVAIWSLGPYLHFNGHVEHAIVLPARLLAMLPVLDNILPARFDLFLDLGLAALLTIFIDRVVLSCRLISRSSVLGALAVLLVGVSIAPRAPAPAYAPHTPRYFLGGGGSRSIRQGTIALVIPYGDGAATMAPMLWQAVSGFTFRMVAGAMYTAGPNGRPSLGRSLWGTGSTMDCVMQLLQAGGSPKICTGDPVGAVKSELDQLGVSLIIMGPMDYGQDPSLGPGIRAFLTRVAGFPPRREQGVFLWQYRS